MLPTEHHWQDVLGEQPARHLIDPIDHLSGAAHCWLELRQGVDTDAAYLLPQLLVIQLQILRGIDYGQWAIPCPWTIVGGAVVGHGNDRDASGFQGCWLAGPGSKDARRQ